MPPSDAPRVFQADAPAPFQHCGTDRLIRHEELPLPNYTLSSECPACGFPTVRRACKVRCERCGFVWDCSEL